MSLNELNIHLTFSNNKFVIRNIRKIILQKFRVRNFPIVPTIFYTICLQCVLSELYFYYSKHARHYVWNGIILYHFNKLVFLIQSKLESREKKKGGQRSIFEL